MADAYHQQFHKAIELATVYHMGQIDKQGEPYILHIMRVTTSNRLTSLFERTCAALHDIVEDTDIEVNHLYSFGFNTLVVTVVDGLTRRPGDAYDSYIQDYVASKHPLAAVRLARIRVKLADLDDHISRIQGLSHADRRRLAPRYIKSREYLELELIQIEGGDL